MTKEQARKRRRRTSQRMWDHDWCLCRRCAPSRWEKYLAYRSGAF